MLARFVSSITLVVTTLGLASFAHANPLSVKIAQGKLHGKRINHGEVRAFLGIPYAAPPVGNLRWKAPQPAPKWKGEREAYTYGARCMQVPFEDMIFQDGGMSEDCLYLNVFTPANAKETSKLPVMFWIHGGGYTSGSASEPRHDGDFLPTKGVVLVTINYRLGVFGFLATPELMKEGDGAAGNYGLMDMIAALRWVQENIADFGGDPQNVTIFGESAGSSSVSTLMASPLAQGLFNKAIGESGSALGGDLSAKPAAEIAPTDADWAQSIGANSLADLRAMPAETILQASRKAGAPKFRPVVDGKVLTETVAQTYAEGKQAHVPLLAGWNRDEGSSSTDWQGMTVAQWKKKAEDRFGDHAAEFLELYPENDDAQARRSALDYDGDTFIAFNTWKWIEAQVKTGGAVVYRYHFELPAPPSKFHGAFAFHSDDIEYVFGTLDTRPGATWRPEDRKLSEEMMEYWTDFAKTGDPNGSGLPEWPRYEKTGEVLHLDSDTHAAPDTTRARYEFLLKYLPPGEQH